MRNIPDDNLAYPVLISLNTGSSGSGFQLITDTQLFLVTAKHVLFDKGGILRGQEAILTSPSRDVHDDTVAKYKINLIDLLTNGLIFQHASADVAGIMLGKIVVRDDSTGYTPTLANGVTMFEKTASGTVSVNAAKSVCLLKDVLISNDIFLYGYPSSLGLKASPQFDYDKPLLRKGIVASVNKKQGTIILDCPVYYGNSGGPVVQVTREGFANHHKIIGVVSQFIPYSENWINQSNGLIHQEVSNSGYSVAVSMDFVFEMLNIKIPLVPSPSGPTLPPSI